VSYIPLDGQKVNFDYVEADFNSPCSTADKAVTVTCIDFSDNPVANQDCTILNAEIVARNCDDGSEYFFLLTQSGEILDAYLAAGINYSLEVGMLVDFAYEIAHFESPCSIADNAAIITCIQDAGDVNTDDLIFEKFSFLSDLVDPNDCRGANIEVYDMGAFAFIFVDYGDNSGSLHLNDGTLYCTNSVTNNCKELYGLNNPDDLWTCTNLVNDSPTKFIKTNPVNTSLDIYPNPTSGAIHIQLPTFSDETIGLQVVNLVGNIVSTRNIPKVFSDREFKMDLSNLKTGIYYIRIASRTETFIHKIFKE